MSLDVMARAWKHSRQTGSALLALLALASSADDDGVIWLRGVTVEFIGSKARTKKRQTQNILRALEDDGEVYAPPTAGRGKTTRYFVTIGLDRRQIALVLVREFGCTPMDAAVLADAILDRQTAPAIKGKKVQPRASFSNDSDAPEVGKPREKVQSTTPFEKVQPDASFDEKRCNPLPEKGAIRYAKTAGFGASQSARADPIRSHDHDHDMSDPPSPTPTHPQADDDGGGPRSLFHELRRRQISRPKATTLSRMGLDPDTLLTSIDNLIADGKTIGHIIGLIEDAPPEKGKPYERQLEAARRSPAQPVGGQGERAPLRKLDRSKW